MMHFKDERGRTGKEVADAPEFLGKGGVLRVLGVSSNVKACKEEAAGNCRLENFSVDRR